MGQLAGTHWAEVVMATTFVGLEWVFLYFMYQKKVFLRV
jgi:hypothetical protein